MKTKLIKFKAFFSIEKEQAWLESMSAQGWHLAKNPDLFYTFVKGEAQNRLYRIDFRHFKTQADFEDYLTLFSDSGWECISPKRINSNFYFFSEVKENEKIKDIFSDTASKAQLYHRAAGITLTGFLPFFILFFSVNLSPGKHFLDFTYLTPGLWEMQGKEFLWHFLFETPFVILRSLGYFFPLIILLIFLYFYLQSWFSYRKESTG